MAETDKVLERYNLPKFTHGGTENLNNMYLLNKWNFQLGNFILAIKMAKSIFYKTLKYKIFEDTFNRRHGSSLYRKFCSITG